MNFEELVETAKKSLLTNGSHSPQLVINSTNSTLLVLLADFGDEKNKMLYQLGAKIAKEADGEKKIGLLTDFYFISEAWMAKYGKDEIPNVMPSQHPEKVECLIICHYDFDTQKYSTVTFEMLRTNGKITDLKRIMKEISDSRHFLLDNFVQGYKKSLSKDHTVN